jgi:hypothetical protein
MRITIDTQRDSYEDALATLQAAYRRPVHAPGYSRVLQELPAGLSDESIVAGWSEQHLFRLIAQVLPNAREVLRYLVHQGLREVPYEQVRAHFAEHPTHPIGPRRMGGTLTSVDAVRKQVSPSAYRPIVSDEKQHVYRLDPRIAQGLRKAFEVADAHPHLLRT